MYNKSNRKLFSWILRMLAWHKHSRGWENSRICKQGKRFQLLRHNPIAKTPYGKTPLAVCNPTPYPYSSETDWYPTDPATLSCLPCERRLQAQHCPISHRQTHTSYMVTPKGCFWTSLPVIGTCQITHPDILLHAQKILIKFLRVTLPKHLAAWYID